MEVDSHKYQPLRKSLSLLQYLLSLVYGLLALLKSSGNGVGCWSREAPKKWLPLLLCQNVKSGF
jgi:hypothetical protein